MNSRFNTGGARHRTLNNRFKSSTIRLEQAIFFSLVWCAVYLMGVQTGFCDGIPAHCLSIHERGLVNWSTGKITAAGRAGPDSENRQTPEDIRNAAIADARYAMIDIFKTVKLTRIKSVAQYAQASGLVFAGIERAASAAVMTDQVYTTSMAVEISVEASMYGGFLQLVLPDDIRQISGLNIQADDPLQSRINPDAAFTGLIIDARGLGVEPVLNPTIVSEQGHNVYSSTFISREFAVQSGVCKYLCSMEKAQNDKRVGPRPLVLKGLRKAGDENACLVISMADCRTLEKLVERHRFLRECRVIIVLDQQGDSGR